MKSKVTHRTRFIRIVAFIVYLYFGHIMSFSVVADSIDCSATADTHTLSPPTPLYDLALSGSAVAQFEIGLLYEYGRGVNQDDSIAVCWYERSADQSYENALYRLAVLYDNGWGLSPDKTKALELYKSAAEKGHPFAQHDLGKIYFQGTDAPKNLLYAYMWLKIASMREAQLMQKHLNLVAKEMTADEIAEAEYLVQRWLEYSGKEL